MAAIYKKELRAYLSSMMGYVIIAFTLLAVGIYSTALNLVQGYPNIEYVLDSVLFIFLIIIPILTMRVFAEERKQKTDQLLLTAPVSLTKVVMGKYLAMLTVFAIPMAIISLYPLVFSMYGNVNFTASYSALLAFLCLGAAFIAIGMFMSSLTENQIIAAVTCFGALLLCYLMEAITGLMPSSAMSTYIAFSAMVLLIVMMIYHMTRSVLVTAAVGIVLEGGLVLFYIISPQMLEGALTAFFGWFSVYSRMAMFIYGIFDVAALVYFLSLAALFVFFTVQFIEKRRWS